MMYPFCCLCIVSITAPTPGVVCESLVPSSAYHTGNERASGHRFKHAHAYLAPNRQLRITHTESLHYSTVLGLP